MKYENKIEVIVALLFILLISILYKQDLLFTTEKYSRDEIESCKIEDTLSFDGVITDYSGALGKKSGTVMLLLDDRPISIPRYNSSFGLWVGDSIKKTKGTHFYTIKHNNRIGKIYDTVYFQCP